jgi:hypothetical protein
MPQDRDKDFDKKSMKQRSNSSEKSRKNIFFHIGPYKTGSTWIQKVLFKNRENLAQQGFLYPLAGLKGEAHHDLYRKMIDESLIEKILSEFESSKADVMILSSEHLSLLRKAGINKIIDIFPDVTLIPTIVSRRPDRVLLSHWGDCIKSGETESLVNYAFKRLRENDLNFQNLLTSWGQIGNGKVICYEEGGNIGVNFFNALGLTSAHKSLTSAKTPRARVGLKAQSAIATQLVLERFFKEYPLLDTEYNRTRAAKIVLRALPDDDSPELTILPFPRVLLSEILKVTREPGLAADSGWDLIGKPWSVEELERSSTDLNWEEWVKFFGGDSKKIAVNFNLKVITDKLQGVDLNPGGRNEFSGLVSNSQIGKLISLAKGQRPISQGHYSIPKKIVQYFDTALATEKNPNLDSWKKINPAYGYQCFDLKNAMEFARTHGEFDFIEAISGIISPSFDSSIVADAFGLFYLYYEGGFYFDSSYKALAPIEKFFGESKSLYLVQRHNGTIVNSIIGCAPRHPFLRAALNESIQGLLGLRISKDSSLAGAGRSNLLKIFNKNKALLQANKCATLNLSDLKGVFHSVNGTGNAVASLKDKLQN